LGTAEEGSYGGSEEVAGAGIKDVLQKMVIKAGPVGSEGLGGAFERLGGLLFGVVNKLL